jgi:hypothetical protein
MSASEELAAIQARLVADEDEHAEGVIDQTVRDRRYLLSLLRDQLASLEKVAALASSFAERGERIEEQFGGAGTNHAIRAAGLGDGYREAARSIRAALGSAVSEPLHDAPAAAMSRSAPEYQPQRGSSAVPPEALAG